MDTAAAVLLLTSGLFGLVIAMSNWRMALLGTIVIGFVQDPLRKLVEGEPVYLVGLCAGAMILSMMGAISRHGPVSLKPLVAGDSTTRLVLILFIALVLLQAALCLVRFGSVPMAFIGVLSYLSPIPAIWLGYLFARDVADIRRLVTMYVVCSLIVVSGIYLARAGFESDLFKQVGSGLVVYDPLVGKLELHSGFMRAPEVAAWHAGAATCLLIVLAVNFRSALLRLVTPVGVLFFVAAGVLTGRRKMLVIVVAFVAIYMLFLYYYRERSGRRALVLVGALSAAILSAALTFAPESTSIRPYVQRGQTVFQDVGERFTDLGLASVGWAIDRAGVLGAGAGVASQGSQHFVFEGMDDLRGAAEGGLGKIVLELGVPGLVLALLASVLVTRNLRRVLALAALYDHDLLKLALGMLALLAANVPVFIGASQIYGDPFVLILLGLMLGFILAIPRILQLRAVRMNRESALRASIASHERIPRTPVVQRGG